MQQMQEHKHVHKDGAVKKQSVSAACVVHRACLRAKRNRNKPSQLI